MSEEKYIDKDIVDLPKGYDDERGIIQPLCDLNMKSASLIVSKPNSWRANHYHKKDWHFIYVLEGSFEYYFRKTNSNEKIKKKFIEILKISLKSSFFVHKVYYYCVFFVSFLIPRMFAQDDNSSFFGIQHCMIH